MIELDEAHDSVVPACFGDEPVLLYLGIIPEADVLLVEPAVGSDCCRFHTEKSDAV